MSMLARGGSRRRGAGQDGDERPGASGIAEEAAQAVEAEGLGAEHDPAASAEVVEPPTLADPPASPWSDGFGRTAVRSLQTLVVVALVALVAYVAVQLRLVIIPVLIAVLIAAALAPVVSRLIARGLGRGLATAITVLVGLVLLGLVVFAVVTGVQGSLPELQSSVDEGIGQLQTFITNGPIPVSQEQLDGARQSAIDVLTGASVRSGALAGASLVGQLLTGVVLALIVLIYLLKDGPSIYAFLISGSKGNRHTRLQHVGERSVGVLGGYVRGTTVVALFDGVVIGGALLVLGVPLAVPLALVTFIAAFIPVIGAVVAGAIAALVTLVTQGPVDAAIIIAVVLVVNQLEGNLVSPLVLGKALSLHPLAILLALTAGTIIAGVVGALLSVPLAAVAWAAVKSWNADKRATTAALTPPPGSSGAAAPPTAAA